MGGGSMFRRRIWNGDHLVQEMDVIDIFAGNKLKPFVVGLLSCGKLGSLRPNFFGVMVVHGVIFAARPMYRVKRCVCHFCSRHKASEAVSWFPIYILSVSRDCQRFIPRSTSSVWKAGVQ